MRRLAVLVTALTISSCGGGDNNSPTAPTSQIPNVTGNYSGTATIVFPEIPRTLSCPVTTVVTQNGNLVSIAPLVLAGQCGGISAPIGQTMIDATGAIRGESGSHSDPSCGVYRYTASGGFFGRELRLSWSGTSSTCYNANMTFVMIR